MRNESLVKMVGLIEVVACWTRLLKHSYAASINVMLAEELPNNLKPPSGVLYSRI